MIFPEITAKPIVFPEKVVRSGSDVYLDELREFAVRDPEKLEVGDKVIFVHLPVLDAESTMTIQSNPFIQRGTVSKLSMMRYRELHPQANFEDEPSLVIFFKDEHGVRRHRYASDSGVIPYGENGQGSYNRTNFTVRIADLKDQGLHLMERCTESYSNRLTAQNAALGVRGNRRPSGAEAVSHRIFKRR